VPLSKKTRPEPVLKRKSVPSPKEVNQKSAEEQLWSAINWNMPAEIEKLINEHRDLDLNWHKNNQGNTLAMKVIEYGHLDSSKKCSKLRSKRSIN
jgi:hypothetical protein